MAKKDFKGGLSSLLGETKPKPTTPQIVEVQAKEKEVIAPKGRPKTVEKEITKTSQTGTKSGETRATFIVKEEHLEKLKALAYWERIQIKELINTMIENYIESYEKENGEIKNIKTKK